VGGGARHRNRRIGEKWYTPYLFILPHLILFIAFVGWPFFLGIWISLHDWDFFDPQSPFVGLENYLSLFTPGSIHFGFFWQTLWNTIIFVLISTPTLVLVGLGLAAMLNSRIRGRNFFRSLFFSPWTLSVAVIGLLWWWVLNGQAGLLTNLVTTIFGDSPGWLTTQPWAWFSVLLATLWWTIGFNTIILLAGMQSIPVDLYEAAAIDGASKSQQFWRITVPLLRPILLLVITLQIIASFQLVGQPQFMTGGGPPTAQTTPVLMYVYNTGFTGRYEIGIASAMAFVVAVFMVIVSFINFRVFNSERA